MTQKGKFILEVPYYSQHLDVGDEKWRPRVCGIVSLKMILDYYATKTDRQTPSIDNLIKENEFINGFGDFGSNHESLVILARNYGYHAHRQEYRSLINDMESNSVKISPYEEKLISDGLVYIAKMLTEEELPAIVSIAKKFSEKNKPHMIVLIGVEKDDDDVIGFYYHDPDAFERSEGMHKFVPIETFKKYWRKMSIYVTI